MIGHPGTTGTGTGADAGKKGHVLDPRTMGVETAACNSEVSLLVSGARRTPRGGFSMRGKLVVGALTMLLRVIYLFVNGRCFFT